MKFALLILALAVESPLVSVDHGDHKDHGAGVAVSSSVVVTNAHVVGTNKLVTVNGRPGRVLAVDSVWDLAAIECDHGVAVLELSARRPAIGERLRCLGYGAGLHKVRELRGIVSDYWHPKLSDEQHMVQLAGETAEPGDSGGPVIDESGKLVGVVWGGSKKSGVMFTSGEKIAAFVDRAKQSPGPAPTFADPATRPAKQDSPQPTTTKVKVCGPNGCREIDVPKAAPVWQWRPMRGFRR